MNRLRPEKQAAVIGALVEGMSVRSVERMVGVHRDTITRLAYQVGEGCAELLDDTMRDLPCRSLELDEVWCFVGKKERQMTPVDDPEQVGDFWVWTALDPETKLIPSHMVGKRNRQTADAFIADLAPRMANRVQISSDGLRLYVPAIRRYFGSNVDYAQIVKSYQTEPLGPGRYSPPKVTTVKKASVIGKPDLTRASTSLVERSNLSLRTSNRRFTRLTLAFSKKPEHLRASVALYHAWYNFCRRHLTIRTTPAVAAGLVNREWSISELVALANSN